MGAGSAILRAQTDWARRAAYNGREDIAGMPHFSEPHPVPNRPSVADFIIAQVGDVGRPRGPLPPTRELGHLPGAVGLRAGVSNLLGWLRSGNEHLLAQSLRYGSVYRHQVVNTPVVCVTDPELMAQLARNEDRAWSAALGWRPFFERVIDATTIDMPGMLDFEPHKDIRRLLQPAFGGAALDSYTQIAVDMFAPAIARWQEQGTVSFKREVRRLFARVAGRIFMGVDDPAQAAMLDRAMADLWRAPTALIPSVRLSPSLRRGRRAFHELYAAFLPRVAAARRSAGTDLFSRMCRASSEVAWLDDAALVRLFIGVMVAAFDTTSMAVTSMAYLLAKHPDWQDRLRREARKEAADITRRDQVKRLVDHELVWKETLRLFPVAPDLPRRALRDVDLVGYRIPAGTLVLVMIGPALRDPRWWTDPSRFDPERFAPDRAEDKRHRGAYMPFGAGAHACIGAQLSALEAMTFWHTVVSRCQIRLARPYEARHIYGPLGVVSGPVDLHVTAVP
jgi:cytochrome P450